MIIVTVMYNAGAQFDLGYYQEHHVPLIKRLWSDALIDCQPLKGVAAADGASAPYQMITLLHFADMPSLQQAMQAHGDTVAADLQNSTDQAPLIQINETI